MRDKNDRVNAYLGSGVTSGLLRLKVRASELLILNSLFFIDYGLYVYVCVVYVDSFTCLLILKIVQEGPVGIAQGFAVGYGFMYAIDQVR